MDGSLIIDKPTDITSHSVVAKVRRAAGTRRVGHAGTLDPFATGVLVVCIGRATRLVQFLVGLDKEYVATVRLGFATDTQDFTGKQISPLTSSNQVSLEDLRRVVEEFTGPQLQMPPMYSAKKIAGERLHRAARAGREVERNAVPITIHSIELIERDGSPFTMNEEGTQDFIVRVRCSSGTYVRTLAHDMGRRLGIGAHLSALRRTAVGRFTVDGAYGLEEVERRGQEGGISCLLVSPADTLAHLPAIGLDSADVVRIMNGRQVELSAAERGELGEVEPSIRLCDADGVLIAVGEYEGGAVRPRVVLGRND